MSRYRTTSLLLAVVLTTLYAVYLLVEPVHELMPERWGTAKAVAVTIAWLWTIATTCTHHIEQCLRQQREDQEQRQTQARTHRLMKAVGMDD